MIRTVHQHEQDYRIIHSHCRGSNRALRLRPCNSRRAGDSYDQRSGGYVGDPCYGSSSRNLLCDLVSDEAHQTLILLRVGDELIVAILFLGCLLRVMANHLLQPMPVGRLSFTFAVDITSPTWLSLGR